jgi:hypothetical protein
LEVGRYGKRIQGKGDLEIKHEGSKWKGNGKGMKIRNK